MMHVVDTPAKIRAAFGARILGRLGGATQLRCGIAHFKAAPAKNPAPRLYRSIRVAGGANQSLEARPDPVTCRTAWPRS
jgi:hypothetical protein